MIRHAKLSEIDKIMSITRACGEKMTAEGVFQWNDIYPNSEAFQEDIGRNELYVLVVKGEVLGCIVISSLKDSVYDDVTWLTKDSLHYYIHRLAVHPSAQRQGYARKLMDFAEEKALQDNIASVRLDTFSGNIRNQQFYEARGYQRLGSIYFPEQSEFPFYCYELVLNG